MVLQLASEEPEGGPWRAEPVAVIVEALVQLGQGRAASGRGVVLAVDGRSSSGKTTLAARLQNTVRGLAVVHTDDIAWWHSGFGWADLLINGVLVPFHRGELVNFPLGWARPRGIHRGCGQVSAAHRRGCGGRAVRGLALGRRTGVGTGRPVGSRAPELGARRAARRGADNRGSSGVDGRGGPVPGRSAALGPRGRAGGRYSRDPFRPSDRTCRRAPLSR